jgi:hypothetical protein
VKTELFSEEDLEKPAKYDMKLYEPLKAEYPILTSFEDKVFQQLKFHYSLIGKLVAHGGDIYASTLEINGAIVRSLNTYRGALWALSNGNPHVFYDCLRSQCETLALLHYCTLYPDYIKAAIVGERKHPQKDMALVNVLTMVQKLDKLHKGILRDYNDLCNLVHPNPASLYASIQPLDEKERIVAITSRLPKMSDEKVTLYLRNLIIWTDWIFEKIIELAQIFHFPPETKKT